jgi:hypothetical protein
VAEASLLRVIQPANPPNSTKNLDFLRSVWYDEITPLDRAAMAFCRQGVFDMKRENVRVMQFEKEPQFNARIIDKFGGLLTLNFGGHPLWQSIITLVSGWNCKLLFGCSAEQKYRAILK